jgi:hypothetical protein
MCVVMLSLHYMRALYSIYTPVPLHACSHVHCAELYLAAVGPYIPVYSLLLHLYVLDVLFYLYAVRQVETV